MKYFIVAKSNAAPFFSDESTHYSTGEDPMDAMDKFRRRYNHPAGLFAAALWNSADDYHKGRKAVARYLSDRALKQEKEAKP